MNEEFKTTYRPFFTYFKEATDPKDIKATHPGILEVPDGKDINTLPLDHFVKIAKSQGLEAVTKALLNLYRWNKERNPGLSKWAKDTQEKVSKAMEKKEAMEPHDRYRKYFEMQITQADRINYHMTKKILLPYIKRWHNIGLHKSEDKKFIVFDEIDSNSFIDLAKPTYGAFYRIPEIAYDYLYIGTDSRGITLLGTFEALDKRLDYRE